MGKFNEIQQETTQSWGGNSFTTTVKSDTVEFDSAKDKFTFKDAVEVPSLKVNGETVGAQVQADWNQSDDTKVDYIKNKPTIEPQAQADWNQNDNTKADFVKNRTHFDTGITTQYVSESFKGWYDKQRGGGSEAPVPSSSSKYILRIKFEDQDKWEEHEISFSNGAEEYNSTYCDQTPDEYTPLIMLGGKVTATVGYNYNNNTSDEHEFFFVFENNAYYDENDPEYEVEVEFKFGEGELKKLEQKFMPDTVVQKYELGGMIFRIYSDPDTHVSYPQVSMNNGGTWYTISLAH